MGRHRSRTAAGFFTRKGSDVRVAYVAAHPAIYEPTSLDTATYLCNPSAATMTLYCARFAESFHVLNGLLLTSFIVCVLAVIAGLFVVTRVSHTTTGILGRLCVLFTPSTALQFSVTGVFYADCVSHAREDVHRRLASANAADAHLPLVFHRRYVANLLIAATALMGAGYCILLSRYLYTYLTRVRLMKENIRQGDVTAMMGMHFVPDDWVRQKQILRSHARSVQVEMMMKNDENADREPTTPQVGSSYTRKETKMLLRPPPSVAAVASPDFNDLGDSANGEPTAV